MQASSPESSGICRVEDWIRTSYVDDYRYLALRHYLVATDTYSRGLGSRLFLLEVLGSLRDEASVHMIKHTDSGPVLKMPSAKLQLCLCQATKRVVTRRSSYEALLTSND